MPRPAPERVNLAARLLALAHQVERLGNGARNGPETFVLAKLGISAELWSLAWELER